MGDHIRKKRLDLGLLQKDVAQRLGVDTASITNWEKGHTSPRLDLMSKVIQFLGYVPLVADTEKLGDKIVTLRRMLGIRQEDLARQLGVDPTTLARWERNESEPLPELRSRVEAFLKSNSPDKRKKTNL